MAQSPKRILVVDDDKEIRALVVDILEDEDYEIRCCSWGEEALEALNREAFDLVLADIRMPRLTGIDLLHHVRRMELDTEVILMTAYASLHTAVQAVRGKAFDYLIKPFSPKELRERVREALGTEASEQGPVAVMHYEDLTIDHRTRQIQVNGRDVQLTRLEFNVLAYLFLHQGRAVPVEELLQEVWNCSKPNERSVATIRSCIHRLRRKIKDDTHTPRYILNVWGVGYRLGE